MGALKWLCVVLFKGVATLCFPLSVPSEWSWNIIFWISWQLSLTFPGFTGVAMGACSMCAEGWNECLTMLQWQLFITCIATHENVCGHIFRIHSVFLCCYETDCTLSPYECPMYAGRFTSHWNKPAVVGIMRANIKKDCYIIFAIFLLPRVQPGTAVATQRQPWKISFIVWKTVANEKFNASAGIRNQLVHMDLPTQDWYPHSKSSTNRALCGDLRFVCTLLHGQNSN